ncbi:hypothetical protein GOV12_06640 [Candidatus Pacearchaeota archaeon]|nr:hypothetical protein [Candidatus Pacearchaeota archaeon]
MLLLLFIIVVFMIDPRITVYNIFIDEEIDDGILYPSIVSGEELEKYGYKYSNNSGIIISTPSYVNCNWKSAKNDDGWKMCEVIFEIEDMSEFNRILNSPSINLDFLDNNIRNIQVSYSNNYLVIDEIYSNLSRKIIKSSDKKKSVTEKKGYSLNEKDIGDEKSRTLIVEKKKVKTILKKNNYYFKKRKFNNFVNVLVNNVTGLNTELENGISNESIIILNDTNETDKNNSTIVKEINESIYENDNETIESVEVFINDTIENVGINEIFDNNSESINDEDEDEVEVESKKDKKDKLNGDSNVEESDENTAVEINVDLVDTRKSSKKVKIIPGIVGNVINSINSYETTIDSSKPFAVKVSFEVPKYSSNQFDFSISDEGFLAYIDPVVTACGTLNSENSIYTLDRNVESMNACFSITGENVTLDCQGYQIIYSSVGTNAIGVYSTADSSNISNCKFLSQDLNNFLGIGVYLSGSNNSFINNNHFQTTDKNEYAIQLTSSEGVLIDYNNINISSNNSYGIYLDDSNDVKIFNNYINNSKFENSCIYLGSSSNFNITSNNISVLNINNEGIYVNSSSGYIQYNNISLIGNLSNGIYINSNNIVRLLDNNISEFGSIINGISIDSSQNHILNNNKIEINNQNSSGIYLFNSDNINLSGNIFLGDYINSSYLYLYGSDSNQIQDCIFNNSGNNSRLIYLDTNSVSNNITNNSLYDNSTNSYGIYLTSGCNMNNINNNSITSFGYGIYLNENSSDNNLSENYIYDYGVETSTFTIFNSSNNLITYNNINSYNSSTFGLYFYTNGRDNNASYNSIYSEGDGAYSLYLYLDADNNSLNFNNLTTIGDNSYGIFIDDSYNNTIRNSEIITSGLASYAIMLYETGFNWFRGGNIYSYGGSSSGIFFDNPNDGINISDLNIYLNNSEGAINLNYGNQNFSFYNGMLNSTGNDVYIGSSSSLKGSWNLTNVSFVNKTYGTGATGNLTVKYYLEISSLYDNGTYVNGSNVSVTDLNSEIIFSNISDVNGTIPKLELVSYIQTNNTNIINNSNYSVVVSVGNQSLNQNILLSSSQLIEFIFNGTNSTNVSEENTSDVSTGSSGGGLGGGSVTSVECIFNCSDWSDCIDKKQTRICESNIDSCEDEIPDIERNCKIKDKKKNNIKEILFDVNLRIVNDELVLGKDLQAIIGLLNIGVPGKVNAKLDYYLYDSNDKLIYSEVEVVPVETQIEFIKNLKDLDLGLGEYRLKVELSYLGQTEPASSEDYFNVVEFNLRSFISGKMIMILVGIFVGFGIIFVFIRQFKIFKRHNDLINVTKKVKMHNDPRDLNN